MSANCITNIPIEISAGGIVPYLNDRDTLSFMYVSKGCHFIICSAAKLTQNDFDLENKAVTIQFEGDHLKSLLLLKKKIENFAQNPMLLISLGVTRSFVAKDVGEKEKNDIHSLCNYAFENLGPGNVLSILLFDYSKKALNGSFLNDALELATGYITKQTRRICFKLTRVILMHPNSNQIYAFHFSEALNKVIKAGAQNLVRIFIKHPKALDICGQDLAGILITAMGEDDEHALQLLLKLSNIEKIPGKSFHKLLTVVIETNRIGLVKTLLDLPNAIQIPKDHFIEILTKAIQIENVLLMQVLTFHPIATQILGDETITPFKTAALNSDLVVINALLINLKLSFLHI